MTRTLIKAGWVVSMDPDVGDLQGAEILIEGNRIKAIGRSLGASVDQVIDAGDKIAMPGLINAHLHVWQSGLRGIGSEWLGPDYHKNLHGNLATRYGPEDNYVANLIGALTQLDCGVTTVLDWCHNLTSLEHAERSVDGLQESGIRAVFAHGTAKPPTREGSLPYTHVGHPRDRVEALRKGRFASDEQRVTLALAILGPHWSVWDVVEHDHRLARELGLLSTSHATKRPADCVTQRGYLELAKRGLLGPDHNIVHANYLDDEELKACVDAGASFTATVLTEMHGHAADPVTLRVRALGGLPSLGLDVETIVTGEFFREMQGALLHARFASLRENAAAGRPPFQAMPVKTREALAWATIGGARAVGLEDQVGSLAPGKKADIVLLRASDLNLYPVHNPLYSVVEQAHAGNVDTVMIDGVVRKQGGKLLFPEEVLRARKSQLVESVARIMRESDYAVAA
ncbi:MAG: amidohydrolase family protein [Hyphomicrobiales bacterium]|nr:amidohydrolase family protein [Hyphomicrobiales bacterium]